MILSADLCFPFLCTFLLLAWHFTYKKFFSRSRSRTKIKTLPGPIRLPFIGSALRVSWESRNATNVELCRRLCRKYGPIMSFKAGVQNFVVVEDYETAKVMLASEDWHARLPNTSLYRELTLNKKVGILFGEGDHWKEIRRFTIRSLRGFGFGHLDTMENSMHEEISELLNIFEEKFVDKVEDVCLHYCFTLPTLNLVWRLICGTRFTNDDEEMLRLVPLIEEAISATSIGTKPVFAFPFLRYIPGATDHPRLLEMFHELQNMFRTIISKKKAEKDFRNEQNDYVDFFLDKIEESMETNASQVYTEDQLIQSCVDLLLASSDTTSNALEFSIFYMLKNPEVQRLVQSEIDMVIGEKRKPSIADRTFMPYTEATILEILRNANIAPLGIRSCVRHTEVAGCSVPKDSFALINYTAIHKDPNIWGDPNVFRPSRFVDENNNVVNENRLLVFGGGKRLCVGYRMARASLFVFFTSLLQQYSFEPSSQNPKEAVSSGFTNTLSPFFCKVKRRWRQDVF